MSTVSAEHSEVLIPHQRSDRELSEPGFSNGHKTPSDWAGALRRVAGIGGRDSTLRLAMKGTSRGGSIRERWTICCLSRALEQLRPKFDWIMELSRARLARYRRRGPGLPRWAVSCKCRRASRSHWLLQHASMWATDITRRTGELRGGPAGGKGVVGPRKHSADRTAEGAHCNDGDEANQECVFQHGCPSFTFTTTGYFGLDPAQR